MTHEIKNPTDVGCTAEHPQLGEKELINHKRGQEDPRDQLLLPPSKLEFRRIVNGGVRIIPGVSSAGLGRKSSNVQERPGTPRGIQEHPGTSRNIQKYPGTSRNI